MSDIKYYLIRERRLGKKENEKYFLYDKTKWVSDERNVIRDHLMGYDPGEDSTYGIGSLSIMEEIEEIAAEEAIKIQNKQTIDYLIEKWKVDMVEGKAKWDKNPGWPAKLVETRFTLNGFEYTLKPEDIGLSSDCWDQGFMESFQGNLRKDLEAVGAIKVYNLGFID